MFRYSRLITLFLAALLAVSPFTSCKHSDPVKPPVPPVEPVPVPPAKAGYRITLFDTDGRKTATHDVATNGILSEDVLNQKIHFRTTAGPEIKFQGSYLKERLQ